MLNNLASSLLQHEYYFWHRRSTWNEKAVKFYPKIFAFKVSGSLITQLALKNLWVIPEKKTEKVEDMEFLGGGWEVIASVLIPPTDLIQYGFLGFFLE